MATISPSKPKAMAWDEYADIVEAEWQLVLNDPACSERKIHRFLEFHPCMLPGYDAFNNAVRREGLPPGPIYEAAFSQPRLLPGPRSYVPDFMWLPTDSQKQWVVLIEIENPLKPWFRQDGQQAQYFTKATGQIFDWMEQIGQLGNAEKFAKRYGISPQMWRDVNQKEEAVARSPHFSDERRAYLIQRIRYWDQQVRSGNFGLIPDRE